MRNRPAGDRPPDVAELLRQAQAQQYVKLGLLAAATAQERP